MSSFIFALGLTLMHFLWQGLLLGCATAVILTLLRNSRAEYRYIVACCGLLACLAWPALELWQRLGNDAAATSASMLALPWTGRALTADADWFNLRDALRGVVGLWSVCAAVLALRMVAGLLWIDRMARQPGDSNHSAQQRLQRELVQLAQRFGMTRTVRLRLLDTLASPITAGWWRPVVMVPTSLATGMPPELLQALLAHELAHIQRHDYLINLLQNVIETLLFYHPAVWWISNRIRVERELIADAVAASQLGEPRRLALALSELERLRFSHHQLAQAANGGDLMKRIQYLLRPAPQSLNWKAAVAMLGVALACVSIYTEATAADKNASGNRRALIDFSKCSKPAWPEGALAAQHTGNVQLNFLVGSDGKVKDSKVDRSSGHPDLDEAARVGITKCQFKPALKAGKPLETWQKMQYVWVLE
ncbi:M56 family metallopeptidase [Duganella sp. sic0402]|uniref:M56 family metallopeptidase n=1 Tax=Duganella sp. sic0402 TaxID=2854786 RepID=UPI001C444B06|nr:M56 family metallopeptidase [Duganella sp. sic0402]MBV7538001.1 M56 family metallopeptidase [Duganella sp. sic0402]